MKKLFVTAALLLTSLSAMSETWYVGGFLYGNICRNGVYFTRYPVYMGQLVGTECPLRDNFGNIVGHGYVSNE